MHVLVLMGGDSPERAVSLDSGKAVAAGLRKAGHTVSEVVLETIAEVIDLPMLRDVDLVFPALHGGFGEDGHLQALLDVLGVPYALSGAGASALAMNKAATKRLMRGAGIPTPDWLQVCWNITRSRPDGIAASADAESGKLSGGVRDGVDVARGQRSLSVDHVLSRSEAELGFPLVVKLNDAGSSVGVQIVKTPSQFRVAFEKVAAQSAGPRANLVLEKYIPGRELTATILLGRRLPLLEIRPQDGFYDYANKYTTGATDYLVPAPVHSPLYEQICGDALSVYDLVGCSGAARVDFRLDEERHSCLEINTIPGMTENSLVPKAAAAVGIDFPALVEDLCLAALAARGGLRTIAVPPTHDGAGETDD